MNMNSVSLKYHEYESFKQFLVFLSIHDICLFTCGALPRAPGPRARMGNLEGIFPLRTHTLPYTYTLESGAILRRLAVHTCGGIHLVRPNGWVIWTHWLLNVLRKTLFGAQCSIIMAF